MISTPPVAEMKEYWRDMHGDRVVDNYYWMYDYFGKGPYGAEAIDYLEAENKYVAEVMQPTTKFQEQLFLEMKSKIKEKDETPPVFKNGYYYYTKTEEGKQYYRYCRKKSGPETAEEVLLDIDAMAEGHEYYSARGFTVSDNNNLLAYAVDTLSRSERLLGACASAAITPWV